MNALDAANNEGSRISATMSSIRALIEKHAPRLMTPTGIKSRPWKLFTREEKREIRRLRRKGASYKELCAQFGRSETQIAQALRA